MRRWYQNVDGVEDAVFQDPARKGSKYWNEGKWRNFIEPLLPPERGTFIEIGCNAGLFLKLATDAGFRDVIGIESNPSRMEQARCYQQANQYPYRLVQQTVGVDLDVDQLPLADVVLFANVHYYFSIVDFARLIDRLKSKVAYCIIVSARVRRGGGQALHYLESPGVRGYFRDWREVNVVGDWKGLNGLDTDDPAPRRQMYGVAFKGNLEAVDMEALYTISYERASRRTEYKHYALYPSMADFFKQVLSGQDFNLEDSALYHYWQTRHPGNSPEWIREKVAYKKELAEDIQRNGMREPIRLMRGNRVLDGAHRLAIARELGYKHILVRRI